MTAILSNAKLVRLLLSVQTYLVNRTISDFLTTVRLLCLRVNAQTEYDLNLLMRMVKRINGTIGYGLRFKRDEDT